MAYPSNEPDWAIEDTYIDGITENKIRPDESLRDYGYLPDAEPTAQELNWQFNNIYQQIVELKAQLADPQQTPINELKFIDGDSRNPAVIYGYGSWIQYAQGRVLIGAGTSTDINGVQKSFAGGSTGGEHETKLTTSQLPTHTHTHKDRYYFEDQASLANAPSSGKETVGYINGGYGSGNNDKNNNTFLYINDVTGEVGANQAHNNIPAYITLYIWKRVA